MLPGTFASPPGPSGYILTALRPGVFHYSDDAYHSLFIFSSKRKHLLVVDFPRSPNSFTSNGTFLLTVATMKVLSGVKPTRVDMVYSHRHVDHIGSAGIYKRFIMNQFPDAKIQIWGTKETNSFLARKISAEVPMPGKIIGRRPIFLNMVDVNVRMEVFGGHTNEDVIVYVPPRNHWKGVIHYVDVVQPGEAPFIQFTLTVDLGIYESVHTRLLRLSFDWFSGGHGKIGNRKDVVRSKQYVKFVKSVARESARDVDNQERIRILERVNDATDVAYRNGAWALNQILQLQIDICERKVIERWSCILSVVDVFAKGHCAAAVLYDFLDQ